MNERKGSVSDEGTALRGINVANGECQRVKGVRGRRGGYYYE